MAFTVHDFSDLVRLLAQHPEWQAELRRLILTEDLLRLPAIVQELAEAQRRTEEQVRELTAAVARLEAVVEELVQAQRRAEERVEQLEDRVGRLETVVGELVEAHRRAEERLSHLDATVRELAEAHRRAEERLSHLEVVVRELVQAHQQAEERLSRLEAAVRELAEAQRRTEERMEIAIQEMGRFQNALGATIEEEAESVLLTVLEEKGYRPLAEPTVLSLDGEIDVVVPIQDQTGATLWAIVEVKTRLSRRVVHDWAQRMRSAGWQERLRAAGVPGPYLVYVFGIRIDQHTVTAVQEQGIGLLTGRGERIPPREILTPQF
ncbi:Chromosome partition protein Smc [bacterium HR10]|nr:Chromosome partition protein Smc [bacterium HR10]